MSVVNLIFRYVGDEASLFEKVEKELKEKSADVVDLKKKLVGKTALHWAVLSDFRLVVDLLIEHGASVNELCSYGKMSPLHIASEQGALKMMKKLVHRYKADVNLPSGSNGWAPLHYAVYNGFHEAADLLLMMRANVHHADNDGNIALHFATSTMNFDLAYNLLLHGSDPNHSNNAGKTPLGYRLGNQASLLMDTAVIASRMQLKPVYDARTTLMMASRHPSSAAEHHLDRIPRELVEHIASLLKPKHFVNVIKDHEEHVVKCWKCQTDKLKLLMVNTPPYLSGSRVTLGAPERSKCCVDCAGGWSHFTPSKSYYKRYWGM